MAILQSMDEILIDEKRYVSSKRAAKVTGYAKDYIGQLCREGRVPARLVGRSWYVLESAIHDHRFGSQKMESETKKEPVKESPLKFQSTWESPRYEAATTEVLPSINRLRNFSETPKASKMGSKEVLEQKEIVEHLQNSWNTLLDKESPPDVEEAQKSFVHDTEEAGGLIEGELGTDLEDDGVPVPVHTVYDLPPEDLLPFKKDVQSKNTQKKEESKRSTVPKSMTTAISRSVASVAIFVAVCASTVALLGSGYLDRIIISFTQVAKISGISVYNK